MRGFESIWMYLKECLVKSMMKAKFIKHLLCAGYCANCLTCIASLDPILASIIFILILTIKIRDP